MAKYRPYERVLGIYPCHKGFGFAVVERRRGLIDWGRAEISRDTDEKFLARLRLQIRRSAPAVLVIEDCTTTIRGCKAQRRMLIVAAICQELSLGIASLSAEHLRRRLEVPSTAIHHDIAIALCLRYPELRRQMPKHYAWRTDPRMNYFHAIALATAALKMKAGG